MRKSLFCAVAVVVTLVCPVYSAQLILNGGFEDPSIGVNNASPTASIPNWTILPSSPTLLLSNEYKEGISGNDDEVYFQTPFGNQLLDLTGVGFVPGGGVSQTVNVVAGTVYRITFAVGNVGFGGNTAYCTETRVGGECVNGTLVDYYSEAARVRLVVGSTDFGIFENSGLAGGTTRGVNWEVRPVVYYTAPSTGAVNVTFYHANINDNFAGLDNVSMEDVSIPEPGTVGLLGAGLLGLGLLRRRPLQ